ncbi:DNA polymerase III subunit gamma and tau [Pseudonocardia sp. MH-G8]|uniref:DNA polymerase III subunit gamma and tau n=1 Tax=Pseudonocardia sp. MH-G8 TaxID=1854588 RepID=UPI000BA0EB25|nr:DNA polymerase III subunit gamma and tau [Pseudonocardia sp. MH-G8]OZM82478.1 DNA polymerase III subunit gamma/tau [Pseudonocardia sp. MH-G8]
MALALYRKYRPAKFAEVVGQEHVTEPLSTALGSGRINHAYLFSGPRGCGKTSSARILARSLNCEQGPTPDPCGVCASCVSLAPGGPGNIDVTELDAASHGGVDDTRELRDRAFFAPAESRYRVFIVDEAHMITTQGFNALLKIVEEPPEHLVFVFATTEPDKVLPTIRSRTHHYPFRLIPPGTLRKLLERICADEGAIVAPPVYPLVLRAGGGSARDTLSVLDQLLAGAGPEGVTYERAVALLGVTDVALIDDVVDALAAGDRAAVFEAVDRLVEAGHDPRRFAADLLQRLRDLVLLQAVPEAAERGLVEAAADEITRMSEQAGKIGAATLARYGEIVHTGLTEMRGATAPRLLLELLCARMLLPAATTAEPGLLERLERLERRNAIAAAPGGHEDADAAGEARRTFRRPSVAPSAGAGDRSVPAAASAAPGEAAPAPETGEGTGSDQPVAVQGRGRPERPETAAAPPQPPEPDSPPSQPSAPVAEPPRSAPQRPSAPQPAASQDPAPGAPSAQQPVRSQPAGRQPAGQQQAPGAGSAPQRPAAQPAATQEPAAPSSAPPPPPAGAGEVTSLDAAAVRRVWSEVLSAARAQSRSIEAMLVNATVRAVQGDTLVLGIGAPSLARRLSEPRNADIVSAALHTVLGVRWQVRCEHGEAPAAAPAPSGGARSAPPRRPAPSDAPQRQQAAPPSARANRPPPVRRSTGGAPEDGVPLPPEPPDDDAPPDDDEEAMLAEAAVPVSDADAVRRDPEEAAIELLTTQLGARAIDQR